MIQASFGSLCWAISFAVNSSIASIQQKAVFVWDEVTERVPRWSVDIISCYSFDRAPTETTESTRHCKGKTVILSSNNAQTANEAIPARPMPRRRAEIHRKMVPGGSPWNPTRRGHSPASAMSRLGKVQAHPLRGLRKLEEDSVVRRHRVVQNHSWGRLNKTAS